MLSLLLLGICTTFIGLWFLVVGLLINWRLKVYFNKFYMENRIKLTVSCLGLSCPMLARGVFDICRSQDPVLDNQLRSDERLYRIIFYVFADLVPILFQLSSLVFGYIRQK